MSHAQQRTRPSGIGRLILLALWCAGLLAYPLSLAAIHTSIAILSLFIPTDRVHYRAHIRRDAVLTAAVSALVWSVGMTTVVGLLTAIPDALLPGFLLSLPVAGLIGWQIFRWAESCFWSTQRYSLVLGEARVPPFFVRRRFVLSSTERYKTMAVDGPPGTGKSTLLRSSMARDILHGASVIVIDTKDNTIDDGLLAHIPPDRAEDVILFDAADTAYPLGFNPLAQVSPERRSLAASELLTVFRRYFGESAWGPRLEHVLLHLILALLETPNSTLLDIPRLLLRPDFRHQVVAGLTSPPLRDFFTLEFEPLLAHQGAVITPVLNKVGPWLAFPELRNIIGQAEGSFDVRDVMDSGKVLLIRIPSGILGEETASLLAALFVAKIQLATQSRADLPPQHRRSTFVYADEFQTYQDASFERLITQARAFKIGLICANQHEQQLARPLQIALARNAATTVHCQLHHGRHRLLVTRIEDEKGTAPRILTPPPMLGPGNPEWAEHVRTLSRTRYGRPREEVEREILERFNGEDELPAAPSKKSRSPKPRGPRVTVDEE